MSSSVNRQGGTPDDKRGVVHELFSGLRQFLFWHGGIPILIIFVMIMLFTLVRPRALPHRTDDIEHQQSSIEGNR
jgi:hypothetical protein